MGAEVQPITKSVSPKKANASIQRQMQVPPIVHEVLRSPGQPLDDSARKSMEVRFGHNFSNVRVHTNSVAAQSARAVNALAYTVGRDVIFGAGQYAPATNLGRRLIAHELTHTLQQAGSSEHPQNLNIAPTDSAAEHEAARFASGGADRSVQTHSAPTLAREPIPPTQTLDPFKDDLENPYVDPGEEQAAEFRRGTLSVVKDPMLEALKKSDAISFLNQLRALDEQDRELLEADATFLNEIHKILHGSAFWIVQLILHFGNKQPLYVRQLSLAVFERNIQRILDLLRAEDDLRDKSEVPGVQEMLEYEFRGTPQLVAMRQILTDPETATATHDVSYDETHYERDDQTGDYVLKNFGSQDHLDMARTGSELRIIVRIKFIKPGKAKETYYPSDELAARWRSGIEEVWNNHFAAFNGTTRLNIVFVPLFTPEHPDEVVTVKPGSGRADQTTWFEEGTGRTAAHEFGHMIGNPDEYRIPEKISDVPAKFNISEQDKKRTTVEGIGEKPLPPKKGVKGFYMAGIMGQGTEAQRRHVFPLLDWYNQNMKPDDEADYNLVKY